VEINTQAIKGEKGTGYESENGRGPFNCDNCEYWRKSDSSCGQEDMKAKSKHPRTKDGRVEVDPKGCCEFIERIGREGLVQIGEVPMEDKRKHRYGKFHAEIHDDGSISIHHEHEEGSHKDSKHAVADLDGLHDSLQDHYNPEYEEAEKAEEKVHPGIHEEIAKMGHPEPGYKG